MSEQEHLSVNKPDVSSADSVPLGRIAQLPVERRALLFGAAALAAGALSGSALSGS